MSYRRQAFGDVPFHRHPMTLEEARGTLRATRIGSGRFGSVNIDLGDGMLRSAASGARIELDAQGLRAYDGAGQTVGINADGTATFAGDIVSGSNITGATITGGSIDGTTVTGGTVKTTGSGLRIEIRSAGEATGGNQLLVFPGSGWAVGEAGVLRYLPDPAPHTPTQGTDFYADGVQLKSPMSPAGTANRSATTSGVTVFGGSHSVKVGLEWPDPPYSHRGRVEYQGDQHMWKDENGTIRATYNKYDGVGNGDDLWHFERQVKANAGLVASSLTSVGSATFQDHVYIEGSHGQASWTTAADIQFGDLNATIGHMGSNGIWTCWNFWRTGSSTYTKNTAGSAGADSSAGAIGIDAAGMSFRWDDTFTTGTAAPTLVMHIVGDDIRMYRQIVMYNNENIFLGNTITDTIAPVTDDLMLSFGNDTNTGFYRRAADHIAVAGGGHLIAEFAEAVVSSVNVRQLRCSFNGTAAWPALSFPHDGTNYNAEFDVGLYKPGPDQLGVTVGGTNSFTFRTWGAEARTIVPMTDNVYNLGDNDPLLRWSAVYRVTSTNPSDIRHKKKVKPLKDALQTLAALTPIQWEYNKKGDPHGAFKGRTFYGVSAQDTLPHLPHLVMGSEEDGYGMNMEGFIGWLIQAVKELADRLTALEGASA